MTNDTSARVRRSSDADRLDKLCRMLRNTLRSFPQAKLLHGAEGFGASLGKGRSLYIRSVGDLRDQDLRDLLVLFATWLAVDPERLHDGGVHGLGGASYMETEERYLSSGRLD
jgi:hypothetical protein